MSTVTTPPEPIHRPSVVEPHPAWHNRSWWLRAVITLVMVVLALLVGSGLFQWLTTFKKEPPRQNGEGLSKTYSVTGLSSPAGGSAACDYGLWDGGR